MEVEAEDVWMEDLDDGDPGWIWTVMVADICLMTRSVCGKMMLKQVEIHMYVKRQVP